ncbi:MAG: YbhB/YbcL family Raf kinase inhibitor-like protein [Candidatus Thermoplasmatota archaeon]
MMRIQPSTINLLILLSIFTILSGCTTKETPDVKTLSVSSSAFINWGPIPRVYTCDDKDISPPLSFSNIPENVSSFVIFMDDIDTPSEDFVHWIIWNIPRNVTYLSAGQTTMYPQGTNDFGTIGYRGPCPPAGTHRYSFTVYALDTMLSLNAGATKKEVQEAIKGHIIAQGQIIGTYTAE